MANNDERQPTDAARARHDVARSVQFYAFLIAVIGCVNLWIYWGTGKRLSLALAGVAGVGLVAWLLYARWVLK